METKKKYQFNDRKGEGGVSSTAERVKKVEYYLYCSHTTRIENTPLSGAVCTALFVIQIIFL